MKWIIDVEKIIEVLLSDGKWHKIANGTFKIDGYLFAEEGGVIRGKAAPPRNAVTWRDSATGHGIACDLNSILAMRYMVRRDDAFLPEYPEEEELRNE